MHHLFKIHNPLYSSTEVILSVQLKRVNKIKRKTLQHTGNNNTEKTEHLRIRNDRCGPTGIRFGQYPLHLIVEKNQVLECHN